MLVSVSNFKKKSTVGPSHKKPPKNIVKPELQGI